LVECFIWECSPLYVNPIPRPLLARMAIAYIEAENPNIFEWDSRSSRGVVIIGAKNGKEAADLIFKEYFFDGSFDTTWNFDECIENSIEFRNQVVNFLEKMYPKEMLREDLAFVISFIKELVITNLKAGTPKLWEINGFDFASYLESNFSKIRSINPLKREKVVKLLKTEGFQTFGSL